MIDFVAYHDLQAQCGLSVFNELSKTHECRWRIDPDQKHDGADVLIMLDHAPHHPDLKGKYKYKFHLPHDIREMSIYSQEKSYLNEYNAFFVPTTIHVSKIGEEREYHAKDVILSGWQKYDAIRNKSETAQDIIYHSVRSGKKVIM